MHQASFPPHPCYLSCRHTWSAIRSLSTCTPIERQSMHVRTSLIQLRERTSLSVQVHQHGLSRASTQSATMQADTAQTVAHTSQL